MPEHRKHNGIIFSYLKIPGFEPTTFVVPALPIELFWLDPTWILLNTNFWAEILRLVLSDQVSHKNVSFKEKKIEKNFIFVRVKI